ncbi:tRNA lysidine(34) synthetase TilS [Aureimonas populi]|uniref:tRNA(Ile)-lysidine synthase n=1 Tax=Aureimonas populi TaxID=1701758 RepID=A0ABW5CG06_9HYPH|nr:tRNA lysidine(34) synthetase TilS [Aureimonas populi]
MSDRPISAGEGLALLRPCLAPGSRAVLAVSGGADSLALLVLAGEAAPALAALGVSLSVATVDHGLRRESADEARFVAKMAARCGLPHTILRWDGAGAAPNLSARAREARYALLAEEARARGAGAVLTAHHRDDQVETHLLAAARGATGPRLAGMRPVRALAPGLVLARPFLGVPAARLRRSLSARGLRWVEDPTNSDPAYARARLRARLAAQGFDEAGIAAALARAGEERAQAERALVRFLRGQAGLSVGEAGDIRFSQAAFAAAPLCVALDFLARAVTAAGGSAQPASREKIARLGGRLRGGGIVHATLGGCRLGAGAGAVALSREFGRRGPDVVRPAPGRRHAVFDGRFDVVHEEAAARIEAFGRLGRGNALEATLPVVTQEGGRVLAAHRGLLRKLPKGTAVLAATQRVGWRLLADLDIEEAMLTGVGQIAANPPEPVGKKWGDHYLHPDGRGVEIDSATARNEVTAQFQDGP